MTKARTLANFISDNNEFADGTISVSEVSGAAPLASPAFTADASFEGGKIIINEVTGSDAYSEIRKTNGGSNFAIVSPEALYLLVDSDNNQTNRGVVVGHNSALPGSSTSLAVIAENGTVFNEPGADVDFRVESVNNANMLFMDASTNRIGIGTNSPQATFVVAGTNGVQNSSNVVVVSGGTTNNHGLFKVFNSSGTAKFRVDAELGRVGINTDSPDVPLEVVGRVQFAGNNNGATTTPNNQLVFLDTNTSINGNDLMGQIAFNTNDTTNTGTAAKIQTRATNTLGSGELQIWSGTPGGINKNVHFRGDQTVFNEDSNDMDFRVESDNNSNMIKVDAGEDAVGIGVAPAANYRTLTIADGLDSAMHINGENAGIYLGTSYTGGFTNNAAIARARVAGYHIQNSQVGDLCIAPERQGDILFGGTDSASGSNNDYVRLAAGGTFNVYRHAVFNENSGDYDFRVESNSDTHAIYLDAGADSGAGRIGFGVSAPEQFVHQANDTGRRLGYVNEWSGGIADIANGATRTITLSNLGNYSAAMVEIWVVWRVSGGSEPAASRILYTFYESANNLHDITVMEFSGKNIVQSDWSTTAGYNQITFNIENTQWAGSTSSWTAGTYHVKAFGSPSIASVIVG